MMSFTKFGCYLKMGRSSSRKIYLEARLPSCIGYNKLFFRLVAVRRCLRQQEHMIAEGFSLWLKESLQMLFG